MANGIDTSTTLADTKISAVGAICFGVVSVARLVVTDRAELGGVVEVVSSTLAVGHKYFTAFTGIVGLYT